MYSRWPRVSVLINKLSSQFNIGILYTTLQFVVLNRSASKEKVVLLYSPQMLINCRRTYPTRCVYVHHHLIVSLTAVDYTNTLSIHI